MYRNCKTRKWVRRRRARWRRQRNRFARVSSKRSYLNRHDFIDIHIQNSQTRGTIGRAKVHNKTPATPIIVGTIFGTIGILNHQGLALGLTIGMRSIDASARPIDARGATARHVRGTQIGILHRGNGGIKDIHVLGGVGIVQFRCRDGVNKSTLAVQDGNLRRT